MVEGEGMYKLSAEKLKQRIHPRHEYDNAFQEYVESLLKLNMIDNPDAKGVARQIVAQGTQKLTERQIYTIIHKGLLPHNYVESCERCGEPIPWEEMFFALDDNLCSYCRHLIRKTMKE